MNQGPDSVLERARKGADCLAFVNKVSEHSRGFSVLVAMPSTPSTGESLKRASSSPPSESKTPPKAVAIGRSPSKFAFHLDHTATRSAHMFSHGGLPPSFS
jgi:hypothetical protein